MASLGKIAGWIGTTLTQSGGALAERTPETRYEIVRVAEIGKADRQSCVFATDARALAEAVASDAGVILVSEMLRAPETLRIQSRAEDARVLWVRDARYAFAVVAWRLEPKRSDKLIAPGADVALDAFVGERTVIGPGAVIGAGVRVGAECTIGARAVVLPGTTLGDRVVVQAGAVLGSDGFGYVRDSTTGAYLRFPQQGTLVLEDEVEVGANTTIDRGALGETRIGRGTKIDNLVHIGHNCRIGRDVVIAAQTGIAGSSTIEDGAVLGGQVGIGDHATVGPGVILGGQAGLLSGKRLYGEGQVFWGTPARPLAQHLRDLAKLRRGHS